EFQVQTVCASSSSSFSTSGTFTTLSNNISSITNKIAIYFNNPVNNSVSSGVNAIYLNNTFADTIVAYINRAKYTIDIAQYDYNQSSGFANIATAINNAYNAGKKIRWIYDGSQPNTGLATLNAGIPTLASPTGSSYGIMHNKFIIIDAKSTNPDDAIVSTGSEDWGLTQMNSSNNNLLFIQDSALAHAYLNEFNMMWGDTGINPNSSLSKFGPFKTDLGAHIFTIAGKTVELYFSPSDGTNNQIVNTINSANTDLYFGVYDFTQTSDANAIIARQTAGVYVAGIVDQYSNTSAAYPILTSGLNTNMKTYSNSNYVYHHKMVIVDPSNACSDPMVLTGSHNWTAAANTLNDENTLIIHSDTIANIYYQAFNAEFTALGGSLNTIAPCAVVACGIPTGLSVTMITSTSATLNWIAVSGATSYNIQYRIVGSSTWSSTTSGTNSVAISGLTPGANYEFQVQTVCSSGTSIFTSSSTFTTLNLPCSTPIGLSVVLTTSTSATVSWTAVSGAISYIIQYRPVGSSTWSSTNSATNIATITGLTPGTNYEFQVQTVCSAISTSSYSTTSNFSTQSNSLVGINSISENNFVVYPNPTKQTASIFYNISQNEEISISVYNMLGQEIISIVKNEIQEQGIHNYDVTLEQSGVFFIQLNIGSNILTKKVVKL
ncbi:MAG: phospholipase D-like domain-containing protein, partial [Bacteroidota bacterium]